MDKLWIRKPFKFLGRQRRSPFHEYASSMLQCALGSGSKARAGLGARGEHALADLTTVPLRSADWGWPSHALRGCQWPNANAAGRWHNLRGHSLRDLLAPLARTNWRSFRGGLSLTRSRIRFTLSCSQLISTFQADQFVLVWVSLILTIILN